MPSAINAEQEPLDPVAEQPHPCSRRTPALAVDVGVLRAPPRPGIPRSVARAQGSKQRFAAGHGRWAAPEQSRWSAQQCPTSRATCGCPTPPPGERAEEEMCCLLCRQRSYAQLPTPIRCLFGCSARRHGWFWGFTNEYGGRAVWSRGRRPSRRRESSYAAAARPRRLRSPAAGWAAGPRRGTSLCGGSRSAG